MGITIIVWGSDGDSTITLPGDESKMSEPEDVVDQAYDQYEEQVAEEVEVAWDIHETVEDSNA